MNALITAIKGAFIGGCIAFALGILSCTCGIINGSGDNSDIIIVPIGAVIGAAIGFWIGLQMDSEEKEAAKREEERLIKEAKDKQYEQWANSLKQKYSNILNTLSTSSNCPDFREYEAIMNMKNTILSDDYRYMREFEREYQNHCKMLKEHIRKALGEKQGRWWLNSAKNALLCLVKTMENDNEDEVIKVPEMIINDIYLQVCKPTIYITFNSYGNANLPLDNAEVMEEMEQKKDIIESKLTSTLYNIQYGKKDILELITDNLYHDFLSDAAGLMWYYAKKKPFNVEKFNMSRNYFGKYTLMYLRNDERGNYLECVSIDELLARIYAKYQIGGIGTASQEISYMQEWCKVKLRWKYFEECRLLASGLAWMGLYENELDVLRKLVEAGAQLSEDVQDRLSFLESGGVTDIMIYSETSTDNFLYDSASIDWSAKEFEAFFRKLAMKKIEINYSLGISNWTKTLPLTSGQKVSDEQLYSAFEELVKDYDGEVICRKANVKAINLENVTYNNAVLFYFLSERNKCATVLFSSEKFGRNLNLTMLTLFTPVKDATIGQLEKYCYALKSNMYIESFRESILQVVDETLRVKDFIYDQCERSSPKKIFDEE